MRYILVLAIGLLAAACSSTGEQAGGAAGGANNGSMTAAAPGSQAHLEQQTGSDRVFFDFDRYNLTPEAMAQVQKWAGWMLANPGVNVLIEGHADERGTRDYNLALGARRSHSVKVALESLGVSGDRIETTTFGKERPAVMGSNEAAWSQNRRAVVVVQGGAAS
jgi:peptidoglycan-associated lipoprotein